MGFQVALHIELLNGRVVESKFTAPSNEKALQGLWKQLTEGILHIVYEGNNHYIPVSSIAVMTVR